MSEQRNLLTEPVTLTSIILLGVTTGLLIVDLIYAFHSFNGSGDPIVGLALVISNVVAFIACLIHWVIRKRAAKAQQEIGRAKARSVTDEVSSRTGTLSKLSIFVSYRRESDAAQAGRISDLLKNEFDIFMDVDAIRLGTDFVNILDEKVAKCDVLLAVIGRDWLDARDEAGDRRLDDPNDYVRLEIATALQRQIPVIPILVDGTKIPKAAQLPEDLQQLSRRNALDLRNASFVADMGRLIQELKTSKVS